MKAFVVAALAVLVGFIWANGYIHPQMQTCADTLAHDIASVLATNGSRWGACIPGFVIGPPDGAQGPSSAAAAAAAEPPKQPVPCPPPFTVEITGPGNRIPLELEIVGPSGVASQPFAAILDTGGVNSFLPLSNLQQARVPLGRPVQVPAFGGLLNAYDYGIRGSQLIVRDGTRFVPMASGSLDIKEVPDWEFSQGVSPLVGPDVLAQGLEISTQGAKVTIQPPCT